MDVHADKTAAAPPNARRNAWLQLLAVVGVSAAYESLFITAGMNHLDEAWPLYAAMRLQAGGVLFDDVLWVFPPGHVLMAWIAYAIDPPGVVAARILYAVWNVALVASVWQLGRHLMPASFAVLGALLLAVAAPRTHLMHALYGYRYLVLTVLALLCFRRRLVSGDPRWLLVAGALSGVALVFRLTPPFALSCAVAVGAVAADRRWRSWLSDWLYFAVGLLVAAAPVLLWYHASVGLLNVWNEVVLHPLGMLQDLPWPALHWPTSWARKPIRLAWVAWEFRLYWVLYVGYAAVLLFDWLRDLRAGRAHRSPLLLAVVVWGAAFFIRSLGRSDEPHLDSVIPPICLLLAHLASRVFARMAPRLGFTGHRRVSAEVALGVLVLGGWIFLNETDVAIGRDSLGIHPILIGDESVHISQPSRAKLFNELFQNIEAKTRPGDVVLDMSASPIVHVATDRLGPGYFDVVMPGTFRTLEDELSFLERLKADPPVAVVWSTYAFDGMKERSASQTAPQITDWVQENYRQIGPNRRLVLLMHRDWFEGRVRQP